MPRIIFLAVGMFGRQDKKLAFARNNGVIAGVPDGSIVRRVNIEVEVVGSNPVRDSSLEN